jgi:outer membrane lipoprotein-sorting protein
MTTRLTSAQSVFRRPLNACDRWRISILAIILLPGVALGSHVRADDGSAEPSAAELVATLSDSLTSIHSLYCEYTVTYGKSDRRKSEIVAKCRFARNGYKWHYGEFTTEDNRRPGLKEIIKCFDGEFLYTYSVVGDGKSALDYSSVQIHDPKKEGGGMDPDMMLGLKVPILGRSVLDAFRMSRPIVDETALPKRGHRPRLRVNDVPADRPSGDDMKYNLSVVLDPDHDFLPGEILITESQQNVRWRGWENRWDIEEFAQVTDETEHRPRWFPIRGLFQQGATGAPSIRLDVAKVQLNPVLPESLFHPQVPDGVALADVTAGGRGQIVIKGSTLAVDGRLEEIADEANRQAALGRHRVFLIIVVNVAALSVLAAGLLFWRRLRKPT